MSETTNSSSNGVTTSELLGTSTVKAEKISARLNRIPGQETKMPGITVKILEGEFAGQDFQYGVINQQVLDKLLSTAKMENGKIILFVPTPDPSKPVNWINYL